MERPLLSLRSPFALFLLSAATSAACLLALISSYPRYFFCDEALHLLEAESLLKTGHDIHRQSWPILFEAFGAFELGLSVYLQIPFVLVLGPHEETIRIGTACVCLTLSCAIALTLSRTQGFSAWWSTPTVIFSSSLLFMHARTGFQAPIAVLLYGLATVSYLAWRSSSEARDRELLTVSLFAAVLSLYTYTAARGWVVVCGVGFAALDWRALWRRRKNMWAPLSIAAGAIAPFLVFALNSPGRLFFRLQSLQHLSAPAGRSVSPKLWSNLITLLDPRYWFGTSLQLTFAGADRHNVAGLPYIPLFFAPLALLGLWQVYRRRSFVPLPHLMALSGAGVFPAALLEVNPLRCFTVWFGIMLLVLIGLSWTWEAVGSLVPPRRACARVSLVGALLGCLLYQTYWTDVKASKHIQDWGFWGIQAGARGLGEWLSSAPHPAKQIFVDIQTFNRPTESVMPYYPAAKEKVSVLSASGLCTIDSPTRHRSWQLSEILFVSRSPVSRMPECGLRFEVVHTVANDFGVPLLYVMSMRRVGQQNTAR